MTPPETAAPLLQLQGVGKSYGGFHAVDDVSLTVHAGERHAVIGPNGAGKTTLFNLVAGTLRVTSGRVVLNGRDVTRAGEHSRARAGVGRTFQHSSLFTTQTCAENVALAVRRCIGLGTSLRVPTKARGELARQVADLIERVGLTDRAGDLVGDLSHGERRQLEVAMALPRTLTVLLIEHDLDVVFSVADRVSVLATGRLLEQGPPEQIRNSPQVEAVYLGTGHDEVFIA
jgi:branched-chain amino acid transport system ATP-binding protein